MTVLGTVVMTRDMIEEMRVVGVQSDRACVYSFKQDMTSLRHLTRLGGRIAIESKGFHDFMGTVFPYFLGGGEKVNFREWYALEQAGLSRGLYAIKRAEKIMRPRS